MNHQNILWFLAGERSLLSNIYIDFSICSDIHSHACRRKYCLDARKFETKDDMRRTCMFKWGLWVPQQSDTVYKIIWLKFLFFHCERSFSLVLRRKCLQAQSCYFIVFDITITIFFWLMTLPKRNDSWGQLCQCRAWKFCGHGLTSTPKEVLCWCDPHVTDQAGGGQLHWLRDSGLRQSFWELVLVL